MNDIELVQIGHLWHTTSKGMRYKPRRNNCYRCFVSSVWEQSWAVVHTRWWLEWLWWRLGERLLGFFTSWVSRVSDSGAYRFRKPVSWRRFHIVALSLTKGNETFLLTPFTVLINEIDFYTGKVVSSLQEVTTSYIHWLAASLKSICFTHILIESLIFHKIGWICLHCIFKP